MNALDPKPLSGSFIRPLTIEEAARMKKVYSRRTKADLRFCLTGSYHSSLFANTSKAEMVKLVVARSGRLVN